MLTWDVKFLMNKGLLFTCLLESLVKFTICDENQKIFDYSKCHKHEDLFPDSSMNTVTTAMDAKWVLNAIPFKILQNQKFRIGQTPWHVVLFYYRGGNDRAVRWSHQHISSDDLDICRMLWFVHWPPTTAVTWDTGHWSEWSWSWCQ